MNKKNKILIGCLALLLVLSVGYALFSETITINGTATAKGEFAITSSLLSDDHPENFVGHGISGIISNDNITISNNVVTTSVVLGAPGSGKIFVFKVENTGTIPARLKSVTNENDVELTNEQGFGWYGSLKSNADKTSNVQIALYPDANYLDDYVDGPYSQDFIPDDEVLRAAILNPGESTYYYIDYHWDSESTSQEEMTLSWTIKLNWEQVIVN